MKQFDKIITEISSETGIDSRVVSEAVRHYISMVRRIIGSGNMYTVNVRGLGTFRPRTHIAKQIMLGRDFYAEHSEKVEKKYGSPSKPKLTKDEIIDNGYSKKKKR